MLQHFERAIRLDPQYVLAYCGLAGVYSKLGFQELVDTKMAYERAEQSAKKALSLDDSLADSHLALAFAHGGDFSLRREQEFKRAIELNPNLADAYLGLAAIYAFTHQWEKCLQEVKKAVELDPLSSSTLGNAGTWNLYAGRYDVAIKYFKEALDLDPGDWFTLDNLGLAHIRSGKIDEGLAEVKKAAEESKSFAFYGDLAYAYVMARKPEEARKLLDELQEPITGKALPYSRIAGVYAVLGEKEKAVDCLEKAYETGSGYLPSIASDFVYENLRGEPRFETLVRKMGLSTPAPSD